MMAMASREGLHVAASVSSKLVAVWRKLVMKKTTDATTRSGSAAHTVLGGMGRMGLGQLRRARPSRRSAAPRARGLGGQGPGFMADVAVRLPTVARIPVAATRLAGERGHKRDPELEDKGANMSFWKNL